MSLISCPQCGKQISDKAVTCPHCKIDVQKVLAEVREEERQRQEKHRRRTFKFVVSVFLGIAFTVLAYLYYIDALNSIPAEYRKQTEGFFNGCESAVVNGNFESGNMLLNMLKSRNLTNRQTRRVARLEKAMIEAELGDIENTIGMLGSTTNNSNTVIDNEVMARIKKEMDALKTYRLDSFQTERLKKVKDQCALITVKQTTGEEYIKLMKNSITGKSEYNERYFLFDIDSDGIPELWIIMGKNETDSRLLVYTYNDGIKLLYDDDASHSSFYKADRYILRVYEQKGSSVWIKYTYNGTSITSTIIFEEDINGSSRDFKKPKEESVTLYSSSNVQPIHCI